MAARIADHRELQGQEEHRQSLIGLTDDTRVPPALSVCTSRARRGGTVAHPHNEGGGKENQHEQGCGDHLWGRARAVVSTRSRFSSANARKHSCIRFHASIPAITSSCAAAGT